MIDQSGISPNKRFRPQVVLLDPIQAMASQRRNVVLD